jgi:hypothetical protein
MYGEDRDFERLARIAIYLYSEFQKKTFQMASRKSAAAMGMVEWFRAKKEKEKRKKRRKKNLFNLSQVGRGRFLTTGSNPGGYLHTQICICKYPGLKFHS